MKISLAIIAILLSTSVHAFPLQVGESYTEMVSGEPVFVMLNGLNTEDNPGASFLIVNGRQYVIQNGSTEKIGSLRVSVTEARIWDNLSGGEIFVTVTSTSSCDDGIRNQQETDVDCGGPCAGCRVGRECDFDYQCSSRACYNGKCIARNTCTNGIRDGDETDVDCGGSCLKCAVGKKCQVASDCQNFMCQNLLCAKQMAYGTCFDRIKNQDELGVDCGGSCQNQCITTRNVSSFCGVGCFFLNDECSCPNGQNTQLQNNAPSFNIEQPDIVQQTFQNEAVKKNLTINITRMAYLPDKNQIYVRGTAQKNLFGIIPVTITVEQILNATTLELISENKPGWTVLAR